MEITYIIAISSVVAAVISAGVSFVYNCIKDKRDSVVKKYELSESLRKEITSWYDRCIHTLVSLRVHIESGQVNTDKYFELNITLYSLGELGRFYFPNYNRDQGKGTNNSEAYKGNRSLIIDLMVESYKITTREREYLLNNRDYVVSELKLYQKGFTSEVFNKLEPDKHNKNHMENTEISMQHEKTFSESEYHPDNRKK